MDGGVRGKVGSAEGRGEGEEGGKEDERRKRREKRGGSWEALNHNEGEMIG